jgi:hypothetical protein
MSLNSVTIKKFLLTAGLLIVLGQGAWQLPALQDSFFPVKNDEFNLQLSNRELRRIEEDLIALNKRLHYLKWFQTHPGPDQKVSANRLRAFPFSECIRILAPSYYWQVNIHLAQKNRVRVERKLRYLEAFLKGIGGEFPAGSSHNGPAIPGPTAAQSSSMQQIQQLQNQLITIYKAKLIELTKQLDKLEDNGNKK